MATYKKTIVAPESKKEEILKIVVDGHDVLPGSNAYERALARVDERKKFISIADQIARDTLYFRNWKFKDSDKMYPTEPKMRTVGKYYPNAWKGPLLVDEPRNEYEIMRAYEKQKFLKSLGYRSIVIEKDSGFWECLEQLGET